MSVPTEISQAAFAMLYLDDLTVAEFDDRKELFTARAACLARLRPFIYLRYGERAGRKIWMPQETHYLSNF
jgi:hypothetical protein